MKKKTLLVALLLMAVGFAAVSTTLLINGTSVLKKNTDDFKVYYSSAKVNGVEDSSVVVDDTHLSFKTTLDTLGQTYVLDYDVTNSSKNYDAKLTMNCTGGNEWLTVVNTFNTADNLLATDTRSGKLTLTLAKSYTGNDLDVEIECTIGANAVERNSMATGTPAAPVQPGVSTMFTIGDGVVINGELFNIIDEDDTTVTLLARYNIDDTYVQNESEFGVAFLPYPQSASWMETKELPKDGISDVSPNVYSYLSGYETYLEGEIETDVVTSLVSLSELEKLECSYNSEQDSYDCNDSPYAEWLVNGQSTWLRNVVYDTEVYEQFGSNSSLLQTIWTLDYFGDVLVSAYSTPTGYSRAALGVRPTVTLSKNALLSYIENNAENYEAYSFCLNEGYKYGLLNNGVWIPDPEPVFNVYGNFNDSYYLCVDDIEYMSHVYGYDQSGNHVYTYSDEVQPN